MSGEHNHLEHISAPDATDSSGGEAVVCRPAGEIERLRTASWRFWLPLATCVFAVSAGLLFFHLGQYPLWADEADTALYAKSIARTGDTLAMIDHNLYAFRNGVLLKNLHGRYQPPLAYYFAAPFVGTNGTGSFWPRVPFASCGLLSVALMLYWMSRRRLAAVSWIVFSLGLLGNVSLFLFCRQCRYYALAILLSLVIVYFYLHWEGRRWKLAIIAVASILLMLTHYLSYAGLYAALGCDYLVFRQRQERLTAGQWLLLLGPQLLAGVCTLAVYNPLGMDVVTQFSGHNLLLDKLKLLWWYLRDLNSCEFGVGLLMLAAPAFYLFDKNVWLLRAPLAILVYVAIVTIASPQEIGASGEVDAGFLAADMRYVVGLIPLCIFLTALAVLTLSRYRWALAIPLAFLAFGTNMLNSPWDVQNWRSTTYEWLDELWVARNTSIDQVIVWFKANIHPGQSVLVVPNYMTYPLMYAVPQALYAWQLPPPAQGQFKDIPPIHFVGIVAPDFILGFGRRPAVLQAIAMLKQRQVSYTQIKTLDIFWDDMTRPELFWRSFKPVTKYNPDIEAVYIWQRDDLVKTAP